MMIEVQGIPVCNCEVVWIFWIATESKLVKDSVSEQKEIQMKANEEWKMYRATLSLLSICLKSKRLVLKESLTQLVSFDWLLFRL